MQSFAKLFSFAFIVYVLSGPIASAQFGYGRVTNAATNEPVPNVDVTLTCLAPTKHRQPCNEMTVKTSATGTFSFSRFLDETSYRVSASAAPGLAVTRLSSIQFDVDFRHRLPALNLKLEPEATIAGKILDEKGQPRSSIHVIALRQIPAGSTIQLTAVGRAISDDSGAYLLNRLPPGNYYIATPILKPNTLVPQNKLEPTDKFLLYAPSALSLEDAIPLHVETGRAYSDIDLHLRPAPLTTFRIQGKAQMETVAQLAVGKFELYLHSRDRSGVIAPGREILLDNNGSFQANVLPGLYTLRLLGTTAVPATSASTPQALPMPHVLSKQDIEIFGRGEYGIQMLIPPPALITGHIYREEANVPTLQHGEVTLRPVESVGANGCQPTQYQPDGTFTITNCDAADYAVKFTPPAGTYIKEITLNNQDALTHPIDLAHGSGGDLKIVIRPGAASVLATLADPSPISSDVVFIPDSWTENDLVPVIHATRKDGRIFANGMPPGHYTAIAINDIDPQLWQNAALVHELQSRGTPFDLAESEQKQLTINTTINSDEAIQIERHLGLY